MEIDYTDMEYTSPCYEQVLAIYDGKIILLLLLVLFNPVRIPNQFRSTLYVHVYTLYVH